MSAIAIDIFNNQSIISITAVDIFDHQLKTSTIAIDFCITSRELIPLLTDMASLRMSSNTIFIRYSEVSESVCL